jgi:hypothetical protein
LDLIALLLLIVASRELLKLQPGACFSVVRIDTEGTLDLDDLAGGRLWGLLAMGVRPYVLGVRREESRDVACEERLCWGE